MINISFAKNDQIDLISEIEQNCFFDEAYSNETLREILSDNFILFNNTNIFTLNDDDELIAYIIFSITIDFTDIYKIFVRDIDRRKGYATMLVDKVADTAKRYNSKKIMLEVRSKNISAISFYNKNKFVEISVRKNYYHNPEDDAVIFERKI